MKFALLTIIFTLTATATMAEEATEKTTNEFEVRKDVVFGEGSMETHLFILFDRKNNCEYTVLAKDQWHAATTLSPRYGSCPAAQLPAPK